MPTIDRAYDHLFVLDELRQRVLEVQEVLRLDHYLHLVYINANMVNFQKHITTMVLNQDEATLFDAHLKLEKLLTHRQEVSGKLVDVEAYDITAEQALHYL